MSVRLLPCLLPLLLGNAFGAWRIEARELASGRSARKYFRVLGPEKWRPDRGRLPEKVADPVRPEG